ncbi:Smr/MutS family protein [Thiobacillus sedimenti]|uniref:Smr/MutS family protein n=1 Tax=Thiobacillus sedimenti TaxID=3110231 RepID=A0ABZ1CFY7_9PROT|nr:Smr/MutS family protein [Thiobacillus sp. SCUT-2]WRS38015.1 Smr/MutS family protein [Thiobacillus sp. SCUT-2]
MKRSRSALAPASFEALARVRRTLREAAAQPAASHAPPHKPHPPVDGPLLFRRAVADAIPLPPSGRAELARPRPQPVARQRRADERQVLVDVLADPWDWEAAVSTGEELFFARPGVPTAAVRKLRRGGWVIRGELDLHGHTGEEARIALATFLNRCMIEDRRCVRIIHGKGLGSKNRLPVLKNKVRHWLMQREDVLAFCQARAVDGGSGAVIVLLKSSTR